MSAVMGVEIGEPEMGTMLQWSFGIHELQDGHVLHLRGLRQGTSD